VASAARVEGDRHLMRVLLVIDSLRPGGAERVVCQLARALSQLGGLDVHLVTLYPSMELAGELEGAGVGVSTLGMSHKYQVWSGVRRLRRLARELDPDVVHVHLFPANLVTALALGKGPRPRPPLVFTEHNEWNRRRRYPVLRPVDAWVYRRFSQITCVSESARAALVRWLPSLEDRLVVLGNPVTLPPTPWEAGGPFAHDVLFVGRLVPAKGLDLLLRALVRLRQRNLVPTVAVAGAGPERASLEALSRRLGLERQVLFLGHRTDVPELMRASRVLALPSRWEGGALVLLEGLAIGVPTVVTRVGEAEELVEDGASGRMIPPEQVDSLAGALADLLESPDRAAAMGRRGREAVLERLTWVQYARRFADLYGSLSQRPVSPAHDPAAASSPRRVAGTKLSPIHEGGVGGVDKDQ